MKPNEDISNDKRLQEILNVIYKIASGDYDFYEEISIQVLDSEYENYATGTLEEYLQLYLKLKRLELGLPAFPESEGE